MLKTYINYSNKDDSRWPIFSMAFNALKNGRLPPIFYFGKHFLDSLIMKNMTLEITELIFNWINLRLISSKKVLATQGQNAGLLE